MEDQDYCDWCMRRPLTDLDKQRSLQLGLPLEQAWACGRCIDSGAYRSPYGGWKVDDDGWEVPEDEWPARHTFLLSDDEVTILANALNAVLHRYGFDDQECRASLGGSRDRTRALHQRLRGGDAGP